MDANQQKILCPWCKTVEMVHHGLGQFTDHYYFCPQCCASSPRTTNDHLAYTEALKCRADGNTSDGYHTFNELYDHRAKLFSVIVRNYSDQCWKSRLHHDGTMYDGMFIVGVNTPEGQASYHYDIVPYWDMFECKEVERAPEWDGHTSQQAIERIVAMQKSRPLTWEQLMETCASVWYDNGFIIAPMMIAHSKSWSLTQHDIVYGLYHSIGRLVPGFGHLELPVEGYGETWICWKVKPTDDERVRIWKEIRQNAAERCDANHSCNCCREK